MRLYFLFVALFAIGSPAWAQDETFRITPENTKITFSIRHLGVSSVDGSFAHFTGVLHYGTAVTAVRVDVDVDPASIDTGLGMRDRSLRNGYLQVGDYPKTTFSAGQFTAAGGEEKLTGALTLHGVTLPVTLRIEPGAETGKPFGERHTIVATTGLSRAAFGIRGTGSFLTMADEVKLRIEIDR